MNSKPTTRHRRPGRPPLGKRPMTKAEIKRRYREKKLMAGAREFSVMLEPKYLTMISEISTASGISKRALVQLMLDGALGLHLYSRLVGANVADRGGSAEEIAAAIRRAARTSFDDPNAEGGDKLIST